jgi:hypothetical protein
VKRDAWLDAGWRGDELKVERESVMDALRKLLQPEKKR